MKRWRLWLLVSVLILTVLAILYLVYVVGGSINPNDTCDWREPCSGWE
jgi:hypothetical protein